MPPRPETMTAVDDEHASSSLTSAEAYPSNNDDKNSTTTPKTRTASRINGTANNNNNLNHTTKRNKSKRKKEKKYHSNNNGMTVSQFHDGQQSLQDAAVARSMSEMTRIQRQHHQHERNHACSNNNNNNSATAAAAVLVVPAKSSSSSSSVPIELEKVVDILPSDHPSAAADFDNHPSLSVPIQTHRTCHLCQRSLPRSRFSERDRHVLSSSLTPASSSSSYSRGNNSDGMTCRTCTMTLCAARLSTSPTNMQLLLLEYAHRSHEMGRNVLLAALSAAATTSSTTSFGGAERGDNINHRIEDGNLENSERSLILHERSIHSSSYFSNINNGNSSFPHGLELSNSDGCNNKFITDGYHYPDGEMNRPPTVANCKYIDALLGMPCYLNVNALGVFGSSAEVSGSLAALEAVRLYGTVGGLVDGEGDGGYHRYFVPHDCDGVATTTGSNKGRGCNGSCGSGSGDGNNHDINDINPRSIVCLVLGEGRTPRTAILASQHYCWTTIAIDPSLSEEWDGYHDDVPNFVGYGGTLADFMDDDELAESMTSTTLDCPPRHLVIIGIQPLHSSPPVRLRDNGHINEIRARYSDVPTTLVSLRPIPETNWFSPSARRKDGTVGPRRSKLEDDLGYEPNFSYVDEGIFSICRQIEVWNFHNADDDDEDDEENYEEEDYEEDGYDEGKYVGEETAATVVEEIAVRGKSLGIIDKVEKEEYHSRFASNKRGGKDQTPQHDTSDQKHPNKPAKQASKKKNVWLEERVAEFKKQQQQQQQAKSYKEEYNQSFNTLSTKGTIDQRRVSEVVENPDVASQYFCQQDIDNSSVLSPQDEDALNRVWDKAMSVYDEQQSLCESSHEHHGDHGTKVEENPHDDLPDGWNAFVDPETGDAYYANSATGESTWDKPSSSTSVENTHHDRHPDDSSAASNLSELTSDEQAGAAAANNKGAGIPSFMQYKPKHHPRLSTITDNDSQSHFDDQSSVSSGIAALSRWHMSGNSSQDNTNSKDRPSTQEHRGSSSQKQQPWHKKESEEMGNGDSFMFDDYY